MNASERIQQLEDYVYELKSTFGLIENPCWAALGLTVNQGKLVQVMTKNDIVTKEMLMFALYDGGIDAYDRDPKILDVYFHKINRKLAPLGIRVENVWGRGRRLSAEAKKILAQYGAEIAGPPRSQSPSGRPPVRLHPIGAS